MTRKLTAIMGMCLLFAACDLVLVQPGLQDVDILKYDDPYANPAVYNQIIKNGGAVIISATNKQKILPNVSYSSNRVTYEVGYQFFHLTNSIKYEHDYVITPTENLYYTIGTEGHFTTEESFTIFPKIYTVFPFDTQEISGKYVLGKVDKTREEASMKFKLDLNLINSGLRSDIVASSPANVRLIARSIFNDKYSIEQDILERARDIPVINNTAVGSFQKYFFIFNAAGAGAINLSMRNESNNIILYKITGTFDITQEYYCIIDLMEDKSSGQIRLYQKGSDIDNTINTSVISDTNLVLTESILGYANSFTLYKTQLANFINNVNVQTEGNTSIGNILIYGAI